MRKQHLIALLLGWGLAMHCVGMVAAQQSEAKPFMDEKKSVPPKREWNREVTSRSGGTIKIEVTSQGPFTVTLIADRSYQAILKGDKAGLKKEDVLLTVNSKGPTYNGQVKVPAGSSWFIIQNVADQDVEFRLVCRE